MPSILPPPDEPKSTDDLVKPQVSAGPGETTIHPAPLEGGSTGQLRALLRYLTQTDVHTYAFSVAANVILSLFPFIVLMLTLSRNVFHSRAMEGVVGDMIKILLPTGQDFVLRNAHPQKGAQIFSVFMLLFSSTGVFLPLEVALNNVWHVQKNRNYLANQAVSLGLSFAVGALAMASVAFSAGQQTLLQGLFFGHTDNIFYKVISTSFLKVLSMVSGVMIFFLIYWILPNRKIPARAVLPTALVVGILWQVAELAYIHALPWLDFQKVYGPFYISVGLMMWAFLSGLLLLAGAHFSATRDAMRATREEERQRGNQA